MPRLLFTKEGPAVWMSHLDLMRTLQRAFRRAGLMLKHSQGYSPHPELSIVMPMSVGVSSVCELADFELEAGCSVPVEEIPARINPVLPEGIRVLDCYEDGKKSGKLALLRSSLRLVFDNGLPTCSEDALRELFARPALIVEKHGKNGPVELDIAPMIREVRVQAAGSRQSATGVRISPLASLSRNDRIETSLTVEILGCAQNPTLNPLLLSAAIERYLPEYKPDFAQCRRLEIYDAEMNVFR